METSQLICCANHLTGFYMIATLALNGLTPAKNHGSNKDIAGSSTAQVANFVFWKVIPNLC